MAIAITGEASTRVNPGAQFCKIKMLNIRITIIGVAVAITGVNCPRCSRDSTRVNTGAQFCKIKIVTY